jgi:aldehyde dehydrogenase (NAD+)
MTASLCAGDGDGETCCVLANRSQARPVSHFIVEDLLEVLAVRDLDDALALANSTAYGLSSSGVTTSLPSALKAIKTLRCDTVNIKEVPGFRVESSSFGGIKDSGLGVKEGVIEAIKAYSFVKTFSLPW